jgi:hypothetical protein
MLLPAAMKVALFFKQMKKGSKIPPDFTSIRIRILSVFQRLAV